LLRGEARIGRGGVVVRGGNAEVVGSMLLLKRSLERSRERWRARRVEKV